MKDKRTGKIARKTLQNAEIPSGQRLLAERILNPKPELISAKTPEVQLDRLLFLWSKGAHAGQLASIIPKSPDTDIFDAADAQKKIQLSTLLLEAGYVTLATQLAAKAYNSKPGLVRELRYPALTLALSYAYPELLIGLDGEVAALQAFSEQRDLFADNIRQNAGSIAVVGNSPVLLDRKDGKEIDDHKVIIRFNNFDLAPEIRQATGERTTIWARTLRYDWLWRRQRASYDLSLLPSVGGGVYRLANGQDAILEHVMRGQCFDFIPRLVYRKLSQHHNVTAPSMGLCVLVWLHDILGGLKTVDLYGFKLIDQAPGATSDYFDQGHPQTEHPHDWATEYRAMQTLAPDYFKDAPPKGWSKAKGYT